MSERGEEREKNLDKSIYYNDAYFSMTQMASFIHQINEINKIKPKNILEVGPGNGFTSSFLSRAGYEVITVDINPDLNPDICAPIDQMNKYFEGRRFDLVVCCEVLEHMPFESFSANIKYLSEAGDRLFLTLPNYARTFGLGGFLRLPKFRPKLFDFHFNVPLKKDLSKGPHFWEVGSEKRCSVASIKKELQKRYRKIDSWRFALNPYHIAFYAR